MTDGLEDHELDSLLVEMNHERDQESLVAEILKRRREQDAQWGGPEHDDTHTPKDWCEFIQKFRNRAEFMGTRGRHENYEDALFDILALALAAIESSRRKRGV